MSIPRVNFLRHSPQALSSTARNRRPVSAKTARSSVEVRTKGTAMTDRTPVCPCVPAGSAFYYRTVVRSGKAFIFRANGQDLYEFTVEAPSTKYRFD